MNARLGKWQGCVFAAILAVTWGAAAAAAQVPDGPALYQQHCRACHGAKGVPSQRMLSLYPKLKTLADSAFLAKVSTDSIVAVLRHGEGRDMKPFADKLSAEQMAAVAKFVKTLAASSTHAP